MIDYERSVSFGQLSYFLKRDMLGRATAHSVVMKVYAVVRIEKKNVGLVG